jgi:GNAT superfamily N-acetyltransferase
MPRIQVDIRDDNRPELEAFLEERLYEFNSRATGMDDGTLLNASVEDEAGMLVAGLNGHTWGGCCEIRRLWVHESMRGAGVGTALMQAAEQEAIRRGCHQLVLSTHSFQAPRFYEKLGFRRLAAIPNYPQGHESIIYIKDLPGASGSAHPIEP